jgi:hypothetical protein
MDEIMYPHRIRLRGPWEAEPVGWIDPEAEVRCRTDGLPPARTVTIPVGWDDLGFGGRTGAVVFRRRFQAPRRLDDWERVWLVQAGMPGWSSWRLNDTELVWAGPGETDELTTISCPVRAEVTALLRERNELAVKVEAGPGAGPFGGAALEIGCRAFIQQVRVQPHFVADGYGLLASVDVASEREDDPLELYALIEGQTVGYFRPDRVGRHLTHLFRLDDRVIPRGGTMTLRIDLVCGALIWDTAEATMTVGD